MDNFEKVLKAVFSHPRAPELLAFWDDIYGKRISYQAGMTPEEVAFREGERSFYQSIEDMING